LENREFGLTARSATSRFSFAGSSLYYMYIISHACWSIDWSLILTKSPFYRECKGFVILHRLGLSMILISNREVAHRHDSHYELNSESFSELATSKRWLRLTSITTESPRPLRQMHTIKTHLFTSLAHLSSLNPFERMFLQLDNLAQDFIKFEKASGKTHTTSKLPTSSLRRTGKPRVNWWPGAWLIGQLLSTTWSTNPLPRWAGVSCIIKRS
jgi:hypothetical protein